MGEGDKFQDRLWTPWKQRNIDTWKMFFILGGERSEVSLKEALVSLHHVVVFKVMWLTIQSIRKWMRIEKTIEDWVQDTTAQRGKRDAEELARETEKEQQLSQHQSIVSWQPTEKWCLMMLIGLIRWRLKIWPLVFSNCCYW